MKKEKFEEGILIKGRDLKGYMLCKVIPEDMIMRNFKYRTGMNEDLNPLAVEGSCEAGLHFSLIEDICRYLDYGTNLVVVMVPDEEDVYVDHNKFRAHRLEIRGIMPLEKIDTWEYLCENGADITVQDNCAVKWAIDHEHLEIMKYLFENGADISTGGAYAVKYAAYNGYLEMIKYLHEKGADLTVENNYAIIWAARNGHLEVVEYLHKNGADITAQSNTALRWAEYNGHTDIVDYLKANW